MNDSNTTGHTHLYHPRGPLVSLPVPSDPTEAFGFISRCLDVGWLVVAPGLEEGEQKEEVGYVLKGACDGNGELTPFLLLYSTNENHSYSFLKVYLNTATDIANFERAAKVKLAGLPEYVGNDKPERGKSAKIDAFIVRLKQPCPVILKTNPKYNETDRAAAMARKEIYKVPRRLFVRWEEDQATRPGDGQRADDAAKRKLLAISGFRAARTAGKVEEWRQWTIRYEWDEQDGAELDVERTAALKRIASGPAQRST